MREISAFDIIGPIMVGPSSSHTAGALKIAKIAGKLAKGKITSVSFKLFGSFAKTYKGHGTDRALLGGILGMNTDDINIRRSFDVAHEHGVKYDFEVSREDNGYHPNTVEITVNYDGGTVKIRGSSIGGGEIEITNINGTEISFSGRYNAVIIRQKDAPGSVAQITRIFEKNKINIAYMRVYRDGPGDDAYSIVEVDGNPDECFMTEMEELPSTLGLSYFKIAD